MKAAVYTRYGLPGVLEIKEVDRPLPKAGEVLVKVWATSLNSSDLEFLRGKPAYTRMMGLLKPRYSILGSDIAGQVVGIGEGVSHFKVGDAVFGDVFERWGGFAEYLCAPAGTLMLKPPGLSFQASAAVPQAAVVALQGLRYNGGIEPGQRVLIIGAGGGAGSFAIQIAKSLGAEVTGIDNSFKQDFMRSLGADFIFDFEKDDLKLKKQRYDLILDLVGRRPVTEFKAMLTKSGGYVMVGGSIPRLLQALCYGAWQTARSARRMGVLAHKQNHRDIAEVLELIKAGKITPAVDRCFQLSEIAEAFQYLLEGRVRGKVVVNMTEGEFSG